jgi:hypothetical protein
MNNVSILKCLSVDDSSKILHGFLIRYMKRNMYGFANCIYSCEIIEIINNISYVV